MLILKMMRREENFQIQEKTECLYLLATLSQYTFSTCSFRVIYLEVTVVLSGRVVPEPVASKCGFMLLENGSLSQKLTGFPDV